MPTSGRSSSVFSTTSVGCDQQLGMSSHSLVLPDKGVWINRLSDKAPHPLDMHMDGIRDRSDESFRAVYGVLANDLLSFAFGMVSDRRTAEDIVQQAFVELVRSAHKIRGDGRSLRAWLFRSVRYGCMDEYRRRSRRPEIPHDEIPDAPLDLDPLADHLDPSLEGALAGLSKRQRTAVVLRHVLDMSGDEIANVLGTTRRAAYAVLSRAEANLRAALGGEE